MSDVANELKDYHIQLPFFIMTLTRYSVFFDLAPCPFQILARTLLTYFCTICVIVFTNNGTLANVKIGLISDVKYTNNKQDNFISLLLKK